ncbi:MAG: type II toxin-antitoxin system VapC family toxin [Desulfohalobiaceae bacterium]
MHVVDSCGWLEWFTDGKQAAAYEPYLTEVAGILVPAIVLYEVYKVLKREVGEEKAILAISYMKRSNVLPLEDSLAIKAADLSLLHGLAMADALVYATAAMHEAPIYTSDADFKGLPLVQWMGDDSS